MTPFSIEELMLFIVGVAGALGGLLVITFRSKCKTISCCCFKCERDVDAVIKDEKIRRGISLKNTTPRPKPEILSNNNTNGVEAATDENA